MDGIIFTKHNLTSLAKSSLSMKLNIIRTWENKVKKSIKNGKRKTQKEIIFFVAISLYSYSKKHWQNGKPNFLSVPFLSTSVLPALASTALLRVQFCLFSSPSTSSRTFERALRHISNVILARTMRLPRVKCLC